MAATEEIDGHHLVGRTARQRLGGAGDAPAPVEPGAEQVAAADVQLDAVTRLMGYLRGSD
jgi:hypothetical protein